VRDRILLFIPCYNCAPQIGRVLGRIKGEIAGYIDEILILDNGSRDGTVEAATAAASKLRVKRVTIARNRANYNLGGSHKAAYAYAGERGFTHVVTLHGDDQGDARDLLPLFKSGMHRTSDACMGARFMTGSRLDNYSTFRVIGNRVFNAIFSLAAWQQVTDLGSGLNVLARSAFLDARIKRLPDDLYFNPYLLLDLIGSGRSVHFFPISWREDDQVSNVKMASQALRTLRAPLVFTFARKTFREMDFRSRKRRSYRFDVVANIATSWLDLSNC
jgi:glycosyltransferase involved in cell wall biosynthesis